MSSDTKQDSHLVTETNLAEPVAEQKDHVHEPDISLLEDRVPVELQAPRSLIIWITLLGMMYLYLSYQPIFYTDIWGHLAYGKHILETKAVPTTEPLMPLSVGVKMVDTAWLSQVVAALLYQQFGIASLHLLYAAPIVISFAIFAWMLFRQTNSHLLTVLGLILMGMVTYHYLTIIRPQLAGFVCYMALLATMLRPWRCFNWTMIPIIFLLWGNLHGSWPMGLLLIGSLLTGRAIDKAFRAESITAVFIDHLVQRYFILLELAILALIINPYGLKSLLEVLSFSGNNNLQALTEWDPLSLDMQQAKMAAVVAIPLMILYRWTPRRVTTGEVMLLLTFGLAGLYSNRLLIWWGPLAAWFMIKHLFAFWKRNYPGIKEYWVDSPRKGLYSVVVVGMSWIFFAYTPFGSTLLHGQPKTPEKREAMFAKTVAAGTPVDAVDFLHRNPPVGQIFNTYEYGDYLLFHGPKNARVFLASHAHLVPPDVWDDYLQIISQRTGWEDKLDRYGVNTILIDKAVRAGLIARLNDNQQWQRVYSDTYSAIFTRKKLILNQ